ncbi:ABC transporter ATP-binding protein [Actinomadura madurae]|uniref:ABC transporter ATP-binding protein n=1 Tax=Actinomadura madurae TaxID=1993 RepID=UPI0020D21C88|nr:ABC transporter ATP-binding protein [Actinomadura madurae]MCQ0009247.1 ABC transporter ATP-binding protein [Actinomadura madurae]
MTTVQVGGEAAVSADSVLAVEGLAKSFATAQGERRIFADIGFEVNANEVACLVGPSGVGKTTLLRCLGGLDEPTAGAIRMSGAVITGPPVGMSVVFQDYSRSLMPWMRVVENVALPLRVAGKRRSARRAVAEQRLAEVGLAGFGDHYPWQLSGGMQQRVAIARALVDEPRILLMDEPFASVDAQTRFDLEDLTLRISRETGVSVLLVTHDIDESVYLGDRVLVLRGEPASITDDIAIDLGTRDQITTRAMPEFAELRSTVLRTIRSTHHE